MDIHTTWGAATEALKNLFKNMTDEMQACLSQCLQCHQHCEHVINHCLEHGGLHSEAEHIQILRDTSAISNLTADFIARQSHQYRKICQLCADICKTCADNCDRFLNDEELKSLAESCRRCADSCQRLTILN